MHTSNDPLEFQVVGVDEAREALEKGHDILTRPGALMPEPPSFDRGVLKRALPPAAPPSDPLPRETVRWIASLPAEARPLHLFMHYPKIGNRLALLWANPQDAQALFDDLLLDHRGDRQGFPKEVFDDLMRLQKLLVERQAPGG